MRTNLPKDNRETHWTSHIKGKMVFYRIGENKIRTVLKSPDRREEGIAPNTVAAMKRNDTPKRKEEIWVMYRPAKRGSSKSETLNPKQTQNSKFKAPKPDALTPNFSKMIMISAWRYPGVTKEGDRVPIPDDILEELGIENS